MNYVFNYKIVSSYFFITQALKEILYPTGSSLKTTGLGQISAVMEKLGSFFLVRYFLCIKFLYFGNKEIFFCPQTARCPGSDKSTLKNPRMNPKDRVGRASPNDPHYLPLQAPFTESYISVCSDLPSNNERYPH